MDRRFRDINLAVLLVLVAAGARADDRSQILQLREEVIKAEIALERSKRVFPTSLDVAGEKLFMTRMAGQSSALLDVTIVERGEPIPFNDLSPSPVSLYALQVTGRAPLSDLRNVLHAVERWDLRVRILDTLHVQSDDGEHGTFKARFALPVYAPVEPPRPARKESELEHLRGRLARVREEQTLIDDLIGRSRSWKLPAAVTLLESLASRSRMAMTSLRVAEDVVLEGAVVGAAARAKLVDSMRSRDLSVRRMEMPPAGGCRPFVMTVVPGPGEVPEVTVTGSAALESRTLALCAVEPVPSLAEVRARGDATGPDALSLRFTDVDLAHVFMAVGDATGEDFVVDPDVRGVAGIAIDGATLGEALIALRSTGVVVSEGPLRRVSRASTHLSAAPSQEYIGEKVSLTVSDADVRTVLCVFESVGLDLKVPAALEGTTTAYVSEMPWDLLLEGILWSTGLSYVIDDSRMFVGTKEAVDARARNPGVSPCASVERARSLQDAPPLLNELDVTDLTLAGVARTPSGWKAYVYGPWRRIHRVEPGLALFDGKVTSVGPDGFAVLTRTSGLVEFRFRE